MRSPSPIRIAPAILGNSRRTVYRIPIRRIILFQFRQAPGESQLLEHRQIRLRIRVIGIDQCPVPIKQHTFYFFWGAHARRVAQCPSHLVSRTSRGVSIWQTETVIRFEIVQEGNLAKQTALFQEAENRPGTLSSRSKAKSSKLAAIPYHPGIFADSTRRTRALEETTTFPYPSGRHTKTISNSISLSIARSFGLRKKTPEELMSRVTSETGYCSTIPLTLLNFRGSFSDALGDSRCSRCTPTACVGTRTNLRGCGDFKSGITRRAGAFRYTSFGSEIAGTDAIGVVVGSGRLFQASARFF